MQKALRQEGFECTPLWSGGMRSTTVLVLQAICVQTRDTAQPSLTLECCPNCFLVDKFSFIWCFSGWSFFMFPIKRKMTILCFSQDSPFRYFQYCWKHLWNKWFFLWSYAGFTEILIHQKPSTNLPKPIYWNPIHQKVLIASHFIIGRWPWYLD